MKISKYTSLVAVTDDLKLAYNASSDKFVALKGNISDVKVSNLLSLKESAPTTFDRLVEASCIIEDDVDEVQNLKDMIVKIDNDDTFLDLYINPTLDCNFRCWYCYETHMEGSCMSDSTVDSIIRFVRTKIDEMSNLKYFALSFFGGEPLLKFDIVKEITKSIGQLCSAKGIEFSVSFTSNGYLINDGIIEFLKHYRSSFQITLDGGRPEHNKTRFAKGGIGSFDQILTNVSSLIENGIHVVLRINYTPENLDHLEDVIDYLKSVPTQSKQFLTVDFQRVWQTRKTEVDETYLKAKELRQEVRELGYHVANNRVIDGVKVSCYANKRNQILINYNGDIFKCTANDFTKENRLGFLSEGNIVEEESGKIEEWMNSRFVNSVCHDCRIAPLCGGGCRRHAILNKETQTCMLGYSEDAIDEFILERFEEYFINNHV